MKLFSRRDRAELAAARAESARLRDERDEALKQRKTAVFNRGQALRQLAGAEAANVRLHGRILELGRRNSALTESDPEYAAQLERRLRLALKAAARYLAAYWKARAENVDLTQRLLASEERARTAKTRADVEGRLVDGASPVTAVEARLRAELSRSEKACGALEEQCRVLQTANEVDARQLRALREGSKP